MPDAAGVLMPAEWAEHERCLMGWPCRADVWQDRLEQARRDYAQIAGAIARYEPVLMLVRPQDAGQAREYCGPDVELMQVELDDSWLRDTGPLFVRDGRGAVEGADFTFNAWGEKFLPYDQDALLARRVLENLGVARRAVDMVLEGGAIDVDGQGTLITTEGVLLNANRNPRLSREQIEAQLRDNLGAGTVVWLADGLVEDLDTDGHVDNICRFVAPGRVLAQTEPDPAYEDHEIMRENLRRLHAARDAAGRELEVIEMPYLARVPGTDPQVVLSYLNFYLANGAVVVPVAGDVRDDDALALIASTMPDREVVAVPGVTLALGGGGVHCITQQQPRAGANP